MRYIYIITISLILASCGPSQEAKNIAAVTCSIMGETRNMDAAVRVEKMNDARKEIGGEPFLKGDSVIKEAFEYGLCEELVLGTYDEALNSKAEEARLAWEAGAEDRKIAEEKQRISDAKPSLEEEFHENGKLKSRTNYQSINDGGERHGIQESYYENGQLELKINWKDGERHGIQESYYENGQLDSKLNFKDGERHGIQESYYENGQLWFIRNFKDGELHGLRETYHENGQLDSKSNFKDGKEDGLSETYFEDGSKYDDACYKNGKKTDDSYCKQK